MSPQLDSTTGTIPNNNVKCDIPATSRNTNLQLLSVPGPLALVVHSIHGGARGEELLHGGGVAVESRPVQRCLTSGAEGLGDVNGWLHPVALHRPPPLQWKKLQSVE